MSYDTLKNTMSRDRNGYKLPDRCVCDICGKIIDLQNYRDNLEWFAKMAERSLCFECMYWMDIIEQADPNGYVINHQYFSFPPGESDGQEIRYALTFDNRLVSSYRLYNHGTIPKRFWGMLPNNARFISKRAAHIVRDNIGHNCQKKGCWDRTHCLWYHGPMDWNEIPKKHKEGSEGCPIYVNRNNPK